MFRDAIDAVHDPETGVLIRFIRAWTQNTHPLPMFFDVLIDSPELEDWLRELCYPPFPVDPNAPL